MKKYNRKPINTFQKGENLVIFLETVKSKGIKLVNIGPDDLQGGNQRLILGLTWTLILRYEVQKYGAGEMELLKWVEKTTEGYKGARARRACAKWPPPFPDAAIDAAFDTMRPARPVLSD